MAMDSRIALPRFGNFQLDDHNVEEWSDSAAPGIRHKARKEVGKWINPDSNADIQYQKREDCKQSDRSKEQTRTEVIQGQAPDSNFQIVRSHSQFQDVGDKSNSRTQSSSTTYQMSSSRGVRSTSKSTSNRTTTKTVVVSGARTDDFEGLQMSYQPLDTSTQRDRIHMNRSGTMGVRRPPTRRHTPAPPVVSSPDPEENVDVDSRDEMIESDDTLRSSPEFPNTLKNRQSDSSGLSIVGFKNISPKIRVGFPVEIQLELQSKLRSSSNLNREHYSEDSTIGQSTYHHHSPTIQESNEETEQRDLDESAIPLFELSANKEDSTFDFKQRRKSFGFESFDSQTKQVNLSGLLATKSQNLFSTNNPTSVPFHLPIITHANLKDSSSQSKSDNVDNFSVHRSVSHLSGISPTSAASRSWDLIQSAHSSQQKREANKKLFNSSSTKTASHQPFVSSVDRISGVENSSQSTPSQMSFRTTNAPNDVNFHESRHHKSFLNSSFAEQDETETPSLVHTHDIFQHDDDNADILIPSIERSRKLLKMLNEAPDLLHKMSYKNYFSNGVKYKEDNWEEDKNGTDWETQRQLSFLNDSLTRILDEGRSKENKYFDKTGISGTNENNDYKILDKINIFQVEPEDFFTEALNYNDDSEFDFDGNPKGALGQVSQTWISSGDSHKPSQKVRDNDVTTSIAATNDLFKRGPKKVEFCKTEVHFTADSGKFHIVETDENKPSTSHLFRRKKKGDKKKQLSTLASGNSQQKFEDQTKSSKISEDQEQSNDEITISSKIEENYNSELLKSSVGVLEELHPQSQNTKEGQSKQDETITQPTEITSTPYSLILKNSSFTSARGETRNIVGKSLPLLSLHKETLDDGVGDEEMERSHIGMEVVRRGEQEEALSHSILSNYGEMKIQRYLKQLKSPSSLRSESPPELDDLVPDPDQEYPSHFRFDNVLYENGSFVPLATRQSLIEMNNRNRKRNIVSQLSTNSSSTMSNYSLPNSDKENSASEYHPFRLARLEAKVETNQAKPQITSVELRYELDNNDRSYNRDPIVVQNNHGKQEETEKHLSQILTSVLPTYVRPLSIHSDRSGYFNVLEVNKVKNSNYEVSPNSQYSPQNKPENYTIYDDQSTLLLDRSIYKNPTCLYERDDSLTHSPVSNRASDFIVSSSNMTASSFNKKNSSKSIVTIGDYEVSDAPNYQNTLESQSSPEPLLSLDHTWKGPAHFENEGTPSPPSTSPAMRCLSFPKSSKPEPEWVYKARSRELRVTDWDLVGRQTVPPPLVKSEPPWMDEIMRVRSKGSSEEIKTLPKISVVYPWQRDEIGERPKPLEDDTGPGIEEIEEKSHIVSIVPAPPLPPRKDGHRKPQEISLVQISKVNVDNRDTNSLIMKSNRRGDTNKSSFMKDSRNHAMQPNDLTPEELHRQNSNRNITNKVGKSSIQSRVVETPSHQSLRRVTQATIKSSVDLASDQNETLRKIKPAQKVLSRKKVETEGYESLGKKPKATVESSKKDKQSRIGALKKSDFEDSSGSSRSNTPIIHQHPTVKVSKLPIRNKAPPGKNVEVKSSNAFGSRIKSKDKHHVAAHPEFKAGKITMGGGDARTTQSHSKDFKSQNNALTRTKHEEKILAGQKKSTQKK